MVTQQDRPPRSLSPAMIAVFLDEKRCFWRASRCLGVKTRLVLITTHSLGTSKVADLSPSSLGTSPCFSSFRQKRSEAVQTSAVGLPSSNRTIVSRSILGPFPCIGITPFGFPYVNSPGLRFVCDLGRPPR